MVGGVPPAAHAYALLMGSVMSAVVWEVFLHWMNIGVPLYRSVPVLLPAGIASALVIPMLVRTPSWAALVIGAAFPYLVCFIGCLYCGAGLFFFPWLIAYWYIFIPAGCAGALLMRLTLGRVSPRAGGVGVMHAPAMLASSSSGNVVVHPATSQAREDSSESDT